MLTGSEAALVSSAGIEQLTYLYPRVGKGVLSDLWYSLGQYLHRGIVFALPVNVLL